MGKKISKEKTEKRLRKENEKKRTIIWDTPELIEKAFNCEILVTGDLDQDFESGPIYEIPNSYWSQSTDMGTISKK
jgi:hypothetical protein